MRWTVSPADAPPPDATTIGRAHPRQKEGLGLDRHPIIAIGKVGSTAWRRDT